MDLQKIDVSPLAEYLLGRRVNVALRDQFVENLQRAMAKAGLNQSSFAQKIGVQRALVNRWIKKASFPSPENLEKIAQLFGIPVTELLESEEMSAQKRDSLSKNEEALGVLRVLDALGFEFIKKTRN